MNTLRSIFIFFLVLFCSVNMLWAGPRTSPFEPPEITDTVFVVDDSQGLDTFCTFRDNGPLVFEIEISRYVGEVDSDGCLKDLDTLVNNGIIAETAILSLPAYDVDYDADVQQYGISPERDVIKFNGTEIKRVGTSECYVYGKDNTWILNEFEVPIEIIKFAEKGSPVKNTISIEIDQANIGNMEAWCMSVDWAALSFEAMPPVVLIHGNSSNGGFWDRRGFTKVLQKKKIPYDNSINLATTTVVANGTSLKNEILAVAQNMGVKNIQIIAHSKGGLDTREFLASHYPQLKKDKKLNVHNFITLSTPHHGAVGADYLEAFRLSRDELDNPNDRTKFAEDMAKDYTDDEFEANEDLTVSSVRDFNNTNKLPTDIKYFSVGADADINSNGTLEENEYEAMELEVKALDPDSIPWYAPRRMITKKMNLMYSVARNFKTVTVRKTGRVTRLKKTPIWEIVETPTSSFKQNDMLVTVESAKYNQFNFIQQFKKNHASVADQEVAREVVKKLKYVK